MSQVTTEHRALLRKHFPSLKNADLTALRSKRGVAAAIPYTSARGKRGRCHAYIVAMQLAGYEMTNGRLTTLESVLLWLLEHPDFRSSRWRSQAHVLKTRPTRLTRVPLIAGK